MTATTPGRAAYEAFMGSLTRRDPDIPVIPWDRLDDLDLSYSPDTQADWEAAAQAAVDVFLAGDTVSAQTIREALAAHERDGAE